MAAPAIAGVTDRAGRAIAAGIAGDAKTYDACVLEVRQPPLSWG
jgi:hypothetical protein